MGISMLAVGGQAPRRRDPTGVAAHDLEDEDFRGGLGHGADVEAGFAVETAMYFATEPNPGQLSVMGRSLSTVLGTWMAWMGTPVFSASCEILRQVSAESPPPL